MASHADRLAPSACVRRRVVLALAVGSCSLAVGSLPISLAHAAHAKASVEPTAPVEAPAPPPPPPKRAEHAAPPQAEGCCAALAPVGAPPPPPAESLEAPAAKGKRHAQPPARPGRALGGEAPAGTGSLTGPGAGTGAGAGTSGATTTGAASSSSPSTSGIGQSGDEATPSAKKGSGGKKEKEKTKEKEKPKKEKGSKGGKGSKGKEAEGTEEETEKQTPETQKPPTTVQKTGASGETHARSSEVHEAAQAGGEESAEAAPEGAVATIASSGASSISSAVPPRVRKVGALSVASTRRSERPRRSGELVAGRLHVAAAAPTTLLAADTTPAVGSNAGSAAAHPAARPHHPHAAQPALEKTITRIVGVVPMAVWILVAGLIALALALAVRSRLTSARTRLLERQRGQLLEDVGVLQAALLPVPPSRLGPVGTSVAYRPADGPGAGGDFYDVFALEDGQLAVIVGDVSGHGREALPHTALLRYTVRAYLEAGLSPGSALQTAGTVLERQLGDSFATVVAATYHPRERTLTYASAGHPPPLVMGSPDAIGPRSIVPVTACSAPPVGAGIRTGTRQTIVSIPGAAQLCFHTDGVTEARVGTDLYGAWRLASALGGLGQQASASDVLERVVEETDARPDDMAACLLAIEGDESAPRIVREELEILAGEGASSRVELFLLACGVQEHEVAELLGAVRARAERRESVVLDLCFDDGPPVVSMRHDNVIHAAALAAVSAS